MTQRRASRTPRHSLVKREPLYKQVKEMIVQSLSTNEWRVGEQIPIEPELAARYGVGISTIRAALSDLVKAGMLIRKQAKGTFVSIPDRHSNLYQFFRIWPDKGAKPLPTSELTSFKKGVADTAIAAALQLDPKMDSLRIYELKNVIRLGGTPVAISDFMIPAALFPGLTRREFLKAAAIPFGVYQKLYGISIIRTVERLHAVQATRLAATILRVKPGAPLLSVDRIAYTFNDVPVEARRSFVLTENYCYRFEEGGTG